MAADANPSFPGWIFPPKPEHAYRPVYFLTPGLPPRSKDPRIGTPTEPQNSDIVLVRGTGVDGGRLRTYFARIDKIAIDGIIKVEGVWYEYWEVGTRDPTVIPEEYWINPIQVPANVSWMFPPNPGPRMPPTRFHVDPRMGKPGAPRVGELVHLRGVGFEGGPNIGGSAGYGPRNSGYGHIIGIGPPFEPEKIIVRVETIHPTSRSQVKGTTPVSFDYWNVGTIAPGSQLMLEQLFRQKRQLPTNMASIIGKFAGTSNPNRIPLSDQAGYKTGSSITNERPIKKTEVSSLLGNQKPNEKKAALETGSNQEIARIIQKNENAPKGLSWLFGSLFGGRKHTRKNKQSRRKTRKN